MRSDAQIDLFDLFAGCPFKKGIQQFSGSSCFPAPKFLVDKHFSHGGLAVSNVQQGNGSLHPAFGSGHPEIAVAVLVVTG